LHVVVAINALYVRTKGKTFFANHMLIDNPLSTDGFINETLEGLRMASLTAVNRADEREIEQTFQAMALLVPVYADIDYATPHAEKFHAHLAASYLSNAVESAVKLASADVLMEGARLMGQAAGHLIAKEDPDGIGPIVGKLAILGSLGITGEKLRPVTLGAIEQLARLTALLIQSRDRDVEFALKEIKGAVSQITKIFLRIPDAPLMSIHSTYLAPYYSSTKMDSLKQTLRHLVNYCLKADADDVAAQALVRSFETWSDGIYQAEKEILLLSIEERSHFTFDMLHWIDDVSELLIALSTSSACSREEDDLQRHAVWLLSVLSWVPRDKETVFFREFSDDRATLLRRPGRPPMGGRRVRVESA
jgi:hypothetical protein